MGKAWGDCVKRGVATLDCIGPLFQNVVTAALLFAGVVTVFMIVFGGIKFILSGGDPKQVEGARQTVTYAVIGLIIILSSFFILNLIGYITHVDCFMKFGFRTCLSP